MGIKNRKSHLYFIFVRYLVMFCAVCMILLGTAILVFNILVNMGVIYPANYVENTLEKERSQLEQAEEITEEMLPFGCRYGVYDESGKYLSGNMPEDNIKKAWNSYLEKKPQAGGGRGFKYYERQKEVCIVLYSVRSVYGDEKLNRILWPPDVIFMLSASAVFLVFNILLVRRFTKNLKEQLGILTEVTQKIKEQDLDFSRKTSSVCEIDEVLESMDQMRAALKNSLEQQWRLEESRKEEAAAIAHDIKTPLTVIRGNSELLAEAEDLEEMKEYNADIRQSTREIEEYLKKLQKMLNSEVTGEVVLTSLPAAEAFEEVKRTAKVLAAQKNIQLLMENELDGSILFADQESLYRAVINIAANAVDFSPPGSYIWVTMKKSGGYCEITVTDSGRGFSEEELAHAKERFYQGDKGRSNTGHYGMGLSIAEALMQRQNGMVILGNSKKTGGGSVKLFVPLQKTDL